MQHANRLVFLSVAAFALSVAIPPALLAADAAAPPQVVTVTSPLVPWIGTHDRALPGSIETMRQSQPTLDQFIRFATEPASDRTEAALAEQGKAGYRIYRAPYKGKDYLVAMDESGAGIGPTLVLNPAATRELFLEAPHAEPFP